jgi:SNF2 family DNA or RNA helicase
MSKRITITPAGRLRVEDSAEAVPSLSDAVAAAVQTAFDESSAAGLLYLVAEGLNQDLPASFVFWREPARRVLEGLRHLGREPVATWRQLAAPPDEQWQPLLADAPPMRGLEYLDTGLLNRLWTELRDLLAERAGEFPGGAEAYLQSLNPVWHLLGRVTFHLAENKRDPDYPFAFLATYTHRLSAGAKLQHLPLAQALKEYAGTKDQAKLTSLLEPVRQAAEESPLVRELLDTKALFRPQAWTVPQAYRFLTEAPKMEQSGLVVRLPDWWHARQPPRPQIQVRVGQRSVSQLTADSLLDFSAQLSLDGETLSDGERRQLLEATSGLILLRGRWVEVDAAKLQEALAHWQELQDEYPEGISFIEGMRLLAGVRLDDDRDEGESPEWSRVVAGDWLRDTLQRIRDPAAVSDCQPGRDLNARLRPYQEDGVRWLWFMTRLGLGACLADDMGLGKTIQVIDLLLQLKSNDGSAERGTSLLIVPASLIGNWRQELERFGPSLRIFYAHRSETDPDDLLRVAADPDKELAGVDLVITTYGLARRQDWLRSFAWRLVVLDEAQAIKNASSAQTRTVKKLDAQGRIVLTGTPVENHLGDLWSIFDFCCPGLLGSAAKFKAFVKRLSQPENLHGYGALRRLVHPYILRRLKTDPHIAPDLPAKTEMRVECGLSKKQAVLYEQIVADLQRRLEDADDMARRGLILSVLMQLKQLCNHPSQYLNEAAFPPEQSGKFQRLAEIGEPIAERQEKVLVFTQFQSLTSPLAGFLRGVFGREGLVLHGGTPVGKRKELVRRFQEDDGPPFFVISLKAGGSGLNLTAASHVVHFDRWWNPAVENQATDRAFRIGQKRNVLVHKFICRGTLEERIDRMLQDKQQLADQILTQGGETMLTEMTDEQLLRFVSLDLNRAAGD